MKKFYAILFASFACLSCEKTLSQSDAVIQAEYQTIPLGTAISSLNQFINIVNPGTKAIEENKYRVDIFGGKLCNTKSAGSISIPDTLFYLVDFDEGGFAVLSANTKLSENIYAYTEAGCLSNDDFVEAFEHLTSEAVSESDTIEIGIGIVPEIILGSMLFDCEFGPYQDILEETKSGATPMIPYGPYVKTKWNQRAPLNNLLNGCATGCSATATAQIIIANRASKSMTFNGKLCDWDTLESVFNYKTPSDMGSTEAQNQAANFMKIIGDKSHCNISYGKDSSSGNAKGVKRALEAIGGYVDVDKHLGFGDKNQKIAKRVIKNGKPVYLRGQGGGHAHGWILDGYVDVGSDDFYHINWGWNGSCDGYYSCGNFNTEKRNFTDNIDSGKSTIARNYVRYYRLVTYSLSK